MTSVLVTRDFGGIGDWLMALAVMKFVNRQRPDVDLRVSFATRYEPLPEFVREAFAASDVVYLAGDRADVSTGHLVYRGGRLGVNLIASMTGEFTQRTGIGVAYEAGVYPRFAFSPPATGGYVAMIAHGKRPHRKDPGQATFARLSELVASRCEVVQLGGAGDVSLPGASRRYLGADFATVASVLEGARLFVGIENGLMVLGGFIGVPMLTLYNGAGWPDRLRFARHEQLCERATPEHAATRVFDRLGIA